MTEPKYTAEYVEKILLMAQDTVSLNLPVSNNDDDSDTELGDFVEDTAPSPEELLLIADRRDFIRNVMEKYLRPRDYEVLKLRFGFDTDNPMTLEAIGEKLRITRERVRQIEDHAISRLQHYFVVNKITKENL